MQRVKRKHGTNAAEFEAVAKALNFSVLLLDSKTNIKFASSEAYKIFGSKDTDEFKSEWRDYFDKLIARPPAVRKKRYAVTSSDRIENGKHHTFITHGNLSFAPR